MAQNCLNVKKGDTVKVISGKHKGKQGKVIDVLPKDNRVIVEGANITKRHTKPNQQMQQGGIIEREAPLHVSNVLRVCNSCKKPTRIGKKVNNRGNKVKYCKKCGEELD